MRIKGGFGWDHRNLNGFRRMFLSTDHRNLNGIYTDFIELLRKKSLEEIFYEMLLTQEMNHRNSNGC